MSNKFDEFGIAENFSKWCFDLEYKDIPNEVIHKIKLIFMDSLGLIFASRNEDYIKAIKKSFTDIKNIQDTTIIQSSKNSIRYLLKEVDLSASIRTLYDHYVRIR